MFERGITPSVISRGNAAMSISLPEFNLHFLDSFLYIKTSLAKCCKLYNLKTCKGTFPLAANTDAFYESRSMPPFNLFINDSDSKEVINEKRIWYYNRKRKPWIFKDEISKQNLRQRRDFENKKRFFSQILLRRFLDLVQSDSQVHQRMVQIARSILLLFWKNSER